MENKSHQINKMHLEKLIKNKKIILLSNAIFIIRKDRYVKMDYNKQT